MDRTTQVDMIHRIFGYMDSHSTTMADEVYLNPVSDYTCRDQARRERDRLFHEQPLLLAHSSELPEAGSYLTDDNSTVPILVVRGRDGIARAFANVCRHRGSKLARDRGSAKRAFVCPFHGWSYDLEGRLAGLPGQDGFEGLDRECLGLRPLPIAEEHGFIWVRPRGDESIDVDGHLQGMQADLAALGTENFHYVRTVTSGSAMNWKLVVDTFLESYHIPCLHNATIGPRFVGNCGPFDGFGPNLRMLGVRRSIEELRSVPESEWNLIPHMTAIYMIFPNIILTIQMGHLEMWRIFPGKDPVNEAVYHVSLYAPEPAKTEKALRHWDANLNVLMTVTETEDFIVGAEAQRGFHSGAQESVIFGRNEPALAHFHQAVKDTLAAA